MAEKPRDMLANVERLHHLMDQHGYAAVVVRSGKNVTYLSGVAYPGTLARHLDFPDSPRAVLLVWPRHSTPVLIVNHYAAPLAQRDSWVQHCEVYDDYAESPYERLATVLEHLGLHEATLGCEKTYVSAARWDEIQHRLPKARLVDCTAMMAQVRWIKTPGEIQLLKEAADLLDAAYLDVFPTVRAGETERDVHSRLVQRCLARGAQWVHGILNSSRNTVAYGGEGETVFQHGDIIRNDYVAYYHGYPGHQSRTVILGRPSDAQQRTYRLMRDIYRRTIDQCRVGVDRTCPL
jgi:Xaa-Pro aminopeptidase